MRAVLLRKRSRHNQQQQQQQQHQHQRQEYIQHSDNNTNIPNNEEKDTLSNKLVTHINMKKGDDDIAIERSHYNKALVTKSLSSSSSSSSTTTTKARTMNMIHYHSKMDFQNSNTTSCGYQLLSVLVPVAKSVEFHQSQFQSQPKQQQHNFDDYYYYYRRFLCQLQYYFNKKIWIFILIQLFLKDSINYNNSYYNNLSSMNNVNWYNNNQQQQQKPKTSTTTTTTRIPIFAMAFSTSITNTHTCCTNNNRQHIFSSLFQIHSNRNRNRNSRSFTTKCSGIVQPSLLPSSSLSTSSSKSLSTRLYVLTTPESIIEQASTKRLLDDLIDESVRIAARRPIMMQFNPSSGWIWKRWKGTVFSETWDSCVYRMIYAASVYLLCTAISTPPPSLSSSSNSIPGVNFYFDIKTPLSGFNVLWGQLLSVTTFTLTFFVNQSYSLWRKCSELSRRLQGRLHDINLSLAAHAARRPGGSTSTVITNTASPASSTSPTGSGGIGTSTGIGSPATTGTITSLGNTQSTPSSSSSTSNTVMTDQLPNLTGTPTTTGAVSSESSSNSASSNSASISTTPIANTSSSTTTLSMPTTTTKVPTSSITNTGSSTSVGSSSSTSTTAAVPSTAVNGASSTFPSTTGSGTTPATGTTSSTSSSSSSSIPSASLYTIEPSTYTPESRQLLELVSRYCRLFNLLTYASFTRSHRPILTPRGMRRLVERGLMTPSEREILITADIPATQRHNAVLLWIIRVFIEGHAAGHFIGHSGFEQQFVDKIHVCRASYGAIGDELQGRMPLAYAHIVQVLVDLVLWMYPFMAFTSGMSGFLCVLGTGLLTLGYQGLFDLAKQFLDPYDNENFGKGEDPLVVDTLIAETNAGSVRWMNGLDKFPVPNHLIKEGKLNDFLLPQRGYTVDELDVIKQQRKEREKQAIAIQEKEELERRKVEEHQLLLRKAAKAMIPALWNPHTVSTILSNTIIYSHNPSTITKSTAFVGKTMLAEKFKRGDFSSASIRKVLDIIDIIDHTTPESVATAVPPLTSIDANGFLLPNAVESIMSDEIESIISSDDERTVDAHVIDELEKTLLLESEESPDTSSTGSSQIDATVHSMSALSTDAEAPVVPSAIRMASSDKVSITGSSSIPYNIVEDTLDVLHTISDDLINDAFVTENGIVVPMETPIDNTSYIQVPENIVKSFSVEEIPKRDVTGEKDDDTVVNDGAQDMNVENVIQLESSNTTNEDVIVSTENYVPNEEMMIQTDSSESQMSIQEYVEKVAKILEAEREELWETTAILNAPPGADSVVVPMVEKISVPTLTTTVENLLPPDIINAIVDDDADDNNREEGVVNDDSDPLAALEMDNDPLAALEMDLPTVEENEDPSLLTEVYEDSNTGNVEGLIEIADNERSYIALDDDAETPTLLEIVQKEDDAFIFSDIEGAIPQQVEQLTIAEIAEKQKEEEERIETEAILNAPPAAESLDFQRKLALMEESMSKIDDDEEWETEAILNAPPAAESLDFSQNNNKLRSTADVIDIQTNNSTATDEMLSTIENTQQFQDTHFTENEHNLEESTTPSLTIGHPNEINDLTSEVGEDIVEDDLAQFTAISQDDDVSDVGIQTAVSDVPPTALQQILNPSTTSILTSNDSTGTNAIATNYVVPKIK